MVTTDPLKDEELRKLRQDKTFAGGKFFGRTPGGIVDLSTQKVVPEAEADVIPEVTPEDARPTDAIPDVTKITGEFSPEQFGITIADLERAGGEGVIVPVGERRFQVTPGGTLREIAKAPIFDEEPVPERAEEAPTVSAGALPEEPTAAPAVPTVPPTPTPEDQGTLDFLKTEYGIDVGAQDFFTNPTKAIKDIVKEVMATTQIPEANEQLEAIAGEVEELENERDDQIEKVNENPFLSEGTRRSRVERIEGKFEGRINARVNRLRLLEGTRDDARQQAQFAATLALNVFDKERRFKQDQLEFFTEQAEKELEARRKIEDKDTIVRSVVKNGIETDVLFDKRTGEEIAELGAVRGPAGKETPVDKGFEFSSGDIGTLLGGGFASDEIALIENDIREFGLDETLKGLPVEQANALREAVTGEKVEEERLPADKEGIKELFRQMFTDEQLAEQAEAEGFTRGGSGIFKRGTGEEGISDYLDSVAEGILARKRFGVSDKDILKEILP
ncbi:MAG: hypothetical protein CMB99_15415 [Flavobacteriaceae bacterium]|nr:hypothetical protein [Flavobacteriaceae bacterium]